MKYFTLSEITELEPNLLKKWKILNLGASVILWKVQLSKKNLTLYVRNDVYFSHHHIFSASVLRNMFGTNIAKVPIYVK